MFKYNTSKNLRVPFQEDSAAKNKRQKTDGRRLRLHGNFTPAMLMGATHDALRASNARVSLSCLRILAHRLPPLLHGLVFNRSPV